MFVKISKKRELTLILYFSKIFFISAQKRDSPGITHYIHVYSMKTQIEVSPDRRVTTRISDFGLSREAHIHSSLSLLHMYPHRTRGVPNPGCIGKRFQLNNFPN